MDGQSWSLIIGALFVGSATLIAAVVTAGLQIATFIRQGHTAAMVADVKKNTDGMATAARETADIAAKAATDARDKDRETLERTTTAALAVARPANGVPTVPGAPVLSHAASATPARMTKPRTRR